MAIVITGLRMEQLNRLVSATTGTKINVVSPANNSYYMNFIDVASSIERMYVSGRYLPISSGNIYVNRIDDQLISGVKYFVDEIYAPSVVGYDGSPGLKNQIDVLNGGLLVSGWYLPTLDWPKRLLRDGSDLVSLNWQNRILSGNWNIESLVVPKSIHSVNRQLLGEAGGNVFDWSEAGNHSYVDFRVDGNFYIGNDVINTEEGLIGDGTNVTIEYANKRLMVGGADIRLDWNNRTLSGDWGVQNLNIYDGSLIFPNGGFAGTISNYVSFGSNLLVANGETALNWETRTLSGIWTVEQLQGIRLITSGQKPATSSSPGISGQILVAGHYLYMHTGVGWGRVPLSTF